MEDCIFCKIVKGEIGSAKIFEDENVFVFLDINPIVKGHCLVVPKKHSEDIFDTDNETLKNVIIVAKDISEKMRNILGSVAVNLVNSSGIEAEQGVSHFHLHILPRYKGDALNMSEWWQSKVLKPTGEELVKIAEEIRVGLN